MPKHEHQAVDLIPLADVFIVGKRRPVDEDAVTALCESIDKHGLQHPITVRIADAADEHGEVSGAFVLVAGAHRVEACTRLGFEDIPAHVMRWDERDARLWEISENLHRAELSPVERAEQIDEWRRLTLEKGAHDAPPQGGRQGNERGHYKTAEALGISRDAVARAEKIAALPQDTRDQAREEGWSQKKLLQAAKPTVEIPAPKEWEDVEAEQKRKFATLWNSLSPNVKAWARDNYIDAPVMDARFG
jgi:ParB family chromosome partitioning protein